MTITVKNGFISDGATRPLYLGEIIRCLECGLFWHNEDVKPCECVSPALAVYVYHHTEDENGRLMHVASEPKR